MKPVLIRRTVAREWLLFVALVVAGLLVAPTVLWLVEDTHVFVADGYRSRPVSDYESFVRWDKEPRRPLWLGESYRKIYDEYVNEGGPGGPFWAVALLPYVLVLFARSLMWSIRHVSAGV